MFDLGAMLNQVVVRVSSLFLISHAVGDGVLTQGVAGCIILVPTSSLEEDFSALLIVLLAKLHSDHGCRYVFAVFMSCRSVCAMF